MTIAPHLALHVHAHWSRRSATPHLERTIGDPGRHPIHHGIHRGGAHVRDGVVHLTEAPGFGMEIDWGFLETCRAGG